MRMNRSKGARSSSPFVLSSDCRDLCEGPAGPENLRRKVPRSREEDRHWKIHLGQMRVGLKPMKELRHAVDLIIVPAVREGQHFVQKFSEPRGSPRQIQVPRLDLCRLSGHSIDFAANWLHADRVIEAFRRTCSEVLQKI